MHPPKTDIESPNEEEKSAFRRNSSNGDDSDNFTNERKPSTAALLRNPLVGMTREQLIADVDAFVNEKGLGDHREDFRKGALIAQVMNTKDGFEQIDLINEDEKTLLRREVTHRWSQPFMLYFLCTLCAGSAIVQGMDQTAVNGAQVGTLLQDCSRIEFDANIYFKEFYYEEFNLRDPLMQGLMNGAPYLCSALIGCWTNPILNKIGGRRFTIFISCFVSVVTGFWMAVADS